MCPGWRRHRAVVQGFAQFVDHSGKSISNGGAPTFGISYDPDPKISIIRLVQGTAPTTSDEVVMDESTAQKDHFHVGDRVKILLSGPSETFTITGIARYGTLSNLAGATLAAFDLPTAQGVFNRVGQFDAIDVVAQPGADKSVVQRDIAKVLPHGVEVVTGQTVASEATNQINQALSFFSTGLLVFAFIALFVGAFTILNTFSIIVGQRTRELALLRIVGASRRQVFRSVLGEAAIVGLVSSLIGIGLGVLSAIGLEALLRGFGVDLPTGAPVFEARTVIVALIVGVGVTVVVGDQPRTPRGADPSGGGDQRTADRQRRLVPAPVHVGASLALLGALLLGIGLAKPAIQLVGLGAVGLFVGVAMLSPAVARPLSSVIGRPLARWLGVSGRLGRENSMRSPRRTAQTAPR